MTTHGLVGGHMDRRLGALRIRRQIDAIRKGAVYWRRRNRPSTAAELERVAGFLESLIEPVPFALPNAPPRSTERP